jgi:phenylacetate-coenzyme A ligase PaaK-like adenylate-forming protein
MSIFVILFIVLMLLIYVIQEVVPKYVLKQMYSTVGTHHPEMYELWTYCKENVPYYSKSSSLADIEAVDKRVIRENYSAFFSKEKYAKRMEWTMESSDNAWTAGLKKSKKMTPLGAVRTAWGLVSGRSFAQVTGGTSGDYYYQWYDLRDVWWGGYSFVKGWQKMGWKPKDRILLYYFHGANSVKLLEYSNMLRWFPLSISVLVPSFTPNFDIDDKSVREFVRRINKEKPELIVSFPNVIFRVCQKMYEQSLVLTHIPKYMDLSADFLFTCQYAFIQRMFPETDIRMSYGAIEFGQIAQQVPGKMYTYEVYDDVAFVENDAENNIIVSAYNHRTIPLLRYKTDDKGRVRYEGKKQYIDNLVGKQNGIVDYIELDGFVNRLNHSSGNGANGNIINARIHPDTQTLILTALASVGRPDAAPTDRRPVGRHLTVDERWNGNIEVEVCTKQSCETRDSFNRKVTPILKEYDFTKIN